MLILLVIAGWVTLPARAQDPPATAPAPQPAADTAEQLLEQAAAEREAAGLPLTQCETIEQVLRFWIDDDGFLAARTTIPPLEGETRVVCPLPGIVRLRVHDLQAVDDRSRGRSFTFMQNDLSGGAHAITHIHSLAGRLVLARDSETDDGQSSIQLIQDPPQQGFAVQGQMEDPVRFLVRIIHEPGSEPDVNLTLSAASFVELRRKFPRELETYLRPILRDFAQDAAIFVIDSRVAWQVLGAESRAEAQVVAQVEAILKRMDSDDFKERQLAAHEMEALGQRAVLALRQFDLSKLSAEQSAAVDAFLAPYQQLSEADVKRLGQSIDFLLDTLASDDVELRRLAWDRLRDVAPDKVTFEPEGADDVRARQLAVLRRALIGASGKAAPAR